MRWFGRPDGDFQEELDAHIEMEVRENVERGMSPKEARSAALRTFGNALAVREQLAEERPLHFWHDLYGDLRYGLRLLRRTPGLTATIVLILALGIGANTAIFSLVNAVLLRVLPVRDPQSLVIVRALMRTAKPDWFSHTDYEWLRDHAPMFSSLAASIRWRQNLESGERKERLTLFLVSGNYFATLGVQPAVGRLLTPEDEMQKRLVAVISYAYWQRAFGGRADALGSKLRLEHTTLEIVGVAPPAFHGEFEYGAEYYPAFWTPLGQQPAMTPDGRSFLNTRNVSWLNVVGRLGPGIGLRQAQAATGPLLASLRADLHVDKANDYLGGIAIEPGGGGLSGAREQYGRALRLLMALVALVLLIACANVANLLLARATARRREFAVRLAIGAGRARVLRQLLTESLLLAAMACAAGLVVGQGFVRAFLAMSNLKSVDVHPNAAVSAFALAISCLAALVFGLAPALQSNRVDPWKTLKETRIGSGRAGWLTPTRVLVVAQTGLSMVLLVASGLLLRTFVSLKNVSPGFDEQVLQVYLDNELAGEKGVDLGTRLLARLAAVPGVATVSYSRFGPIGGTGRDCCVSVEGYMAPWNEDKNVRSQAVSRGYFATLGIRLLEGRDFEERDTKDAPEVAIVNDTLVRHYFGKSDPVGKHFGWSSKGPKNVEIVGVVRDAKYEDLRESTPRLVYVPASQKDQGPNVLEIRPVRGSNGRAADLMRDCRAAIREVNGSVRIISMQPLSETVSEILTPERLVCWLAAGFGGLALLLTSVGLYGILAYGVARRTPEFGIRMALGAGRSTIVKMVLGEGMLLVGIGLGLGFAASVSLSYLLASLLFGVQARDWLSFSVAGLILLVVAAVACLGPARLATRIEPLRALRFE